MHHIHLNLVRLVALLILSIGLGLSTSAQAADTAAWYVSGPWENGLFNDDIAAVRKAVAANHCPNPQAVTIIMTDGNANYRADGSLEYRSSMIYRVENDDGIKNWSESEISWAKWHEDPPLLRVRIINPDGKVVNLTEKDLIEVSSGEGDDQLYSDRKTLKMPYPNVTVGSIIEEEIIHVSRPYLESSGLEVHWGFARKIPVGFNRFTLSYPTGSPVQFKAAGMDKTPAVKSGDKLTSKMVWEIHNQPSSPDREDYTPPGNRQRAVVSVGNAPSWALIADRYAKEIEKILAQEKFSPPKELKLPRNDAPGATLAASIWLNSKIRYTGLELGQNSIIPFPPQKVIERGFGDCKDKATLLVALLRSAGYKAWVSLIRTGPGWDIDPEIFGMTSFNHAIVYVDSGKGFWFDPTVEINRDTSLPFHDQYRYTLIARPGQKELSRTPEAAGTANMITEYRELTLTDIGKGSVVETTEYSGAYDTWYRNAYPYQDPKKAKEQLESYLDSYYGTKKVGKIAWADPRDLSKPFSVSVAGSEISLAVTGDSGAEITINLNNLRSLFIDDLLAEKDPKRTQPFRFNLPFAYKLVSTVNEPAGFQARALPEAVEIKNPAFTFKRHWETVAEGKIRGTLLFETKKVEFSPAEFNTLRQDLKKIFDEHSQLTVSFDHKGEVLRSEGRYAEAFDCYRKLLKDHPDSAIQNKRLSVALLSYSLGQPAVFYAKKATELDPKNADMWSNLATMLMTDGLGRRLNRGFDRDGAIAAWKKAIELAPDNKEHLANLAILYEYNQKGDRYQDQSDLKLSRDAYLGLGKEIADYGLQANLWNVQIRLGDIAAAKLLVPEIKDEAQRNMTMVISEILGGNKAQPMKLLEQKLPLEKRQKYLVGAADNLVDLRHYQDASRLLRQAAIANKEAAALENRADMLDRIKSHDSPGMDCSTPIGTLKNFFFEYLTREDPTLKPLKKYFAKSMLSALPNIGEEKLMRGLERLVGPVMGLGSAHLLADVSLSLFNFESSGDDRTGYRLIAGFEGAGSDSFQFFLVREGKEFRISSWAPLYSVLGRQILSFLDQGNTAAATRWFNWLFPPTKTQGASFLNINFFTNERLARSPWLIRLAAEELVLIDQAKGNAKPGIAALWQRLGDRDRFLAEAAKEGIPEDLQKDLWNSLTFSLADTATTNMVFDSAAAMGNVLVKHLGNDSQFIPWYAMNKALWGQEREAEAIMEAYRDTKPDDREVFAQLLQVYQTTLNFAKLDAESAKYSSRLGANELNFLAWDELFRNPLGNLAPNALERARKSVNLSQSKEKAYLHTLATIYATSGRFDEARSVLAKAIELQPGKEPSPDDWYVIGLIADGYGFHEAALDAYRKVTRNEDNIPTKADTYLLAQYRMK